MSETRKQKRRFMRTGKAFAAPWERSFDRVLTPLDRFIHRQTTSGLLLMLCALVALGIANSPWAESYQHLIHTPLSVGIGDLFIEKSLQHWINEGLMALFFFIVGLELKREILVGELSELRHAALPIVAAIGGMLVPALVFVAFSDNDTSLRGWGIPMATDIAFAIGVLVLLGDRIPKALITFLIALAIADDLGAVLVIALFYTEQIDAAALAWAAGLFCVLIAFNRGGVRHPVPYFLVAILMWMAMLSSGVHATVAGVLTAFTIPALPKYDPKLFSKSVRTLLGRFDAAYDRDADILTNDELRSLTASLEEGVALVQAPLQRLENQFHLPVALLVIPIFALANAGVPLGIDTLAEAFAHPVTQGVIAGLLLGKMIGIFGFSWLAIKLGIGILPEGTRLAHIAGVGLLGGIGFTMAIFIGDLAYLHQPDLQVLAKTGVLSASLLAGILGTAWLWWCARETASQAPTP
ncbi:MAG: NhaA family Na+:H+ antiporter [Motiliproteus sp.]|jgi:NhaA family Na+:H+ antiporter